MNAKRRSFYFKLLYTMKCACCGADMLPDKELKNIIIYKCKECVTQYKKYYLGIRGSNAHVYCLSDGGHNFSWAYGLKLKRVEGEREL